MALSHNTYFDGGVQSLGFERDGNRLTVGVMASGEYHFGTDTPERMTVVSGELRVRLDGEHGWVTHHAGSAFAVPGSSGFDVQAVGDAAYLCEYL